MTTASGIPSRDIPFVVPEPAEPTEFPSGNGWAVIALTDLPRRRSAVYVAVDSIDGLVEAISFIEPHPAGGWLEWSHADEAGRDVYLVTTPGLVI